MKKKCNSKGILNYNLIIHLSNTKVNMNYIFFEYFDKKEVINISFYELYEIARNKKGLTNADVAKEIGVSQASMTGWKKGSIPSIEKLKATCRLLEVSSDDLLELGFKPPDLMKEEEMVLINYYRKADKRGKENIMNISKIEAVRGHPEKDHIQGKTI